MNDGIYTMKFGTPFGQGGGVVVKIGNRLYGGDSGFCWTGSINEEGAVVSGHVDVQMHDSAMSSVFGPLTDFTVHFEGAANESGASLAGKSPQAPGVALSVSLRYLKAA